MADSQPISGVVLDPDGKPVLGARVYVTASPAPMPDVAILSGPSGEFAIGAGNPGVYRLAASADGFGTAEAEVDTNGSRQIELHLPREA